VPNLSQPESRYVSANGLRFRVLHWPGDARRTPFVLLHGLASNARFWEPVGVRLAGAGHPVYAPDLRGHGLTDCPDAGYDFDTLSQDVFGLTAALGLKSVLLTGHSWGGMVALQAAGQAAPAGLAVIDGGITQLDDTPGATWEAAERALTPPRLAGTPLADLQARLESLHPDWPTDVPWREIILANFEVRADGTVAPHFPFDKHMQVVRAMWEFRTYDAFDRLHCPVLMVAARPPESAGTRDQTYLEMKARGEAQARRRIQDLEFVWMTDTDHDVPLHRPERLARLLLDFAGRATGHA
jgi:pimeloyl-ACP methyl ester carboxylesterase